MENVNYTYYEDPFTIYSYDIILYSWIQHIIVSIMAQLNIKH